MADHFSPVLYVFGALYRLAATPAWFFAAQALALGATVLPDARRWPGTSASRRAAPRCSSPLSSPLLAAGLFDFHPSTLAVPFLAAALLFALQDRPGRDHAWRRSAAALCRADLALVLARHRHGGRRRGRAGGSACVAARGRRGQRGGARPLRRDQRLGSRTSGTSARPRARRCCTRGTSSASCCPGKSLSIFAALGGRRRAWPSCSGRAGCWPLAGGRACPVLLSRWEGTGLPWYHYGAPMAPLAIGGTLAGLARRGRPRPTAGRCGCSAAWWGGPLLVLLARQPAVAGGARTPTGCGRSPSATTAGTSPAPWPWSATATR